MARALYSLLLRLALPVAALAFLVRGALRPDYRGSLRERLALGLGSRDGRPLWLHAASVGEVQALAPLVTALARGGEPLLLTVGTPTGLARARRLVATLGAHGAATPRITACAAPWDLPGATRRFLRAWRPRGGVFVETELWPNLLAAARAAAVPMVLVSARVSERSVGRYRRLAPGLARDAVRTFRAIGAQTAADRDRWLRLGAEPARVSVAGNLKFDLEVPEAVRTRGAALRSAWAPERPLWVAGSTHPGEEAACLAAQRRLLAECTGARPLLVLAPRRPERFEDVAQLLAGSGLAWVRLGAGEAACARGAPDVLLLDLMGELLDWYAACDAAFVGGSLVPVGGHNLLEPAALARPVLAGPHCFQAPAVARALAEAGALQTVRDAESLLAALRQCLDDPAEARRRGERALAVVAANRGATQRALGLIAGR